jgi:tRNA/tmRNA/rRNA uracil-C5-methylase (TrmA/RlmC/RlmD family)
VEVEDGRNPEREEEEKEAGEEEEEREEEDEYNFGVVLVDPPRVGLDRHTRKLVSQYEHILYISCGPHSLLRDLEGEGEEEQQRSADKTFRSLAGFGLAETHDVVDMCVLDHFPGTMHIEAAVHLRRRRWMSKPEEQMETPARK